MTLHTFALLDGNAQRNPLNLFDVLHAENNPVGQWVEHGASVPIPAQSSANSVPSPFNGYDGVAGTNPWAYGNHLHTIGGSTYYSSYAVAYGTDLLVLSIFVRPTPANMPANFTIGFETVGPLNTHGHRFAWDAGLDNFKLSIDFGGARGFVDPVKYDGGWRRVGCVYQVGWDLGATELDTTASTFGTFFYPDHSTEVDVWGHMLERRTAVTPATSPEITQIAARVQAQPYLIGLRAEGTCTFEPARAQYGSGRFQVSMKSTPDAGMGLLRRAHPSAPWELCETPRVEGDMNGDGTVTRQITAAPCMRLAITELNNTTTTLGAWYHE